MSLPILPTELINRICSYLKPGNVTSLRLSCNALLQKSQECFGDDHFKTIWMIVTSDSLRQLQEIAAHDYFRTRVQELIMLPVLFEDEGPMSYAAFSRSSFGTYPWPRHEWEDSELEWYKTYQSVVADHQDALNSLHEGLTDCLPRFANLDVFS
jgi:hypothetical protein